MPNAAKDTLVIADCGAKGNIPAGESSFLVKTSIPEGKTTCSGCQFSMRTDLTASLDPSNTDRYRDCVEDHAPIAARVLI